ncbi:MAG: NADH-quinone oxidoreductase subunit L [Chloroflexi bacterium]|nr:NADH-quinone oxidoreductase subunit L [Chloroflexota bacterium]
MASQLVWLIFLLPFLSFAVISLVVRPFLNGSARLSGYIAIAAIGGSLALSLLVLQEVIRAPGHELLIPRVTWVVIGTTELDLGLLVDSLTAVMLVVVSGVSLLVQIYSQGYMHGDAGYSRYFAFMSLFTGSMLGLVMADNLLQLFVFWEGVGLCSYLLIGFWFHRPSAANAAKKAFIVTRAGDFGLLVAILALYASSQAGTLNIKELHLLAETGALGGTFLTWAAIGIFAGAAGKSAQFPLHTWLPDAMEGPTPVSSLIHAATMVAAGVFLVARMFPLFEHSSQALATVAVIGAFTAIFAATMGLVAPDIKRVIAYSTISQLGYMMLGLGMGSVAAGIFHLFNHAFFKCLLFLGAGSVNHATGTFDMRQMGGLRRRMPWTFFTFVIASLSLAGIWPLSGFWSKDEILAVAFQGNFILFLLALATVFMTAFYSFRVIFLTFAGSYRGGASAGAGHGSQGDGHGAPSLHESPAVMVVPMVALSVMAIISGWFNLGGEFSGFLGEKAHPLGFFGALANPLALLSLGVAVAGIVAAYGVYGARWVSAEGLGRAFAPLYNVFIHKYWLDELYETVFVRWFLYTFIFGLMELFDTYIVDGLVNGAASLALGGGRALRRLQTGQLQAYGMAIFLGVLALGLIMVLIR